MDRFRNESFGTEFQKFSPMGSLFQENAKNWALFFTTLPTSGRHNSTMITDRRKLTPKLSLYRMSSFHVYRWNQLRVIPMACRLRTANLPYSPRWPMLFYGMLVLLHMDDDDGRGLMTLLAEMTDRHSITIDRIWYGRCDLIMPICSSFDQCIVNIYVKTYQFKTLC